MKHYNSPVITFLYYGQMDVICASDQGFLESVSPNDVDIGWNNAWGGKW